MWLSIIHQLVYSKYILPIDLIMILIRHQVALGESCKDPHNRVLFDETVIKLFKTHLFYFSFSILPSLVLVREFSTETFLLFKYYYTAKSNEN